MKKKNDREEINLTNIVGDRCANSFVLAFRSMFCTEILHRDDDVKKLISRYLGDYRDCILPYFENGNIKCFTTDELIKKRQIIDNKLDFITTIEQEKDKAEVIDEIISAKRELEYSQLFNSGIYNLGTILAFIDESIDLDMDILEANFLGEYYKGDSLLQKKMELLISVHLGVSNYVIISNQERKEFDWNKHYDVAPDRQYIVRSQRQYQNCKAIIAEINPEILCSQ